MIKPLLFKYLKMIWLQSAHKNNAILASFIEKKETAKILDIGIYRGNLIVERVKNIKNPIIYGIDIDPKALSSAKKLGIKAYKVSAEKKLPFKSNFFDIVSANQIIEHLLNIDLFVEEIRRVLKPGGYLVLSTENLSSWHNIFALICGWQAFSQHLSIKKNIGNPFRLSNLVGFEKEGMHIKIFTLKGLIELFELYGFKIERVFGAEYYPLFWPLADLFSRLDPTHSGFIGLKARKIK